MNAQHYEHILMRYFAEFGIVRTADGNHSDNRSAHRHIQARVAAHGHIAPEDRLGQATHPDDHLEDDQPSEHK